MLSTAQVADDSRLEFSLFLISEFRFNLTTSLGRGESLGTRLQPCIDMIECMTHTYTQALVYDCLFYK